MLGAGPRVDVVTWGVQRTHPEPGAELPSWQAQCRAATNHHAPAESDPDAGSAVPGGGPWLGVLVETKRIITNPKKDHGARQGML